MTQQEQHVKDLVTRIQGHQEVLKLSDSRFVARYQRYLGSTRTWRERLCAYKFPELGHNLEKWENKLQAMLAEVSGATGTTEFFATLPIAQYGESVYDSLQGQMSDRRCAWLIGPTGVGKSWVMKWLARENPTSTAYLHVNRGAKDSMMTLARLLARAVGATEETSGSATYGNVVDVLTSNPLTLMLDDVHEGGVLMLKLIKHLVDDSQARFILGTYPTAWARLLHGSTDGDCEAQQLLGRSLKPIDTRWSKGVTVADVTAYLKLTLGGNGSCRVLAQKITPLLCRHWNFRALGDALELAQMNADDGDGEMSPELVEEAVRTVCPVDRVAEHN